MIPYVDLAGTVCGLKDHHRVPPIEIPPGRVVVRAATRCECGEVFRWRVVCEVERVRLVERKEERDGSARLRSGGVRTRNP